MPVTGRFSADNAEAVLRAALSGVGIALVAEVVARAEVAAGRLEPLLPDFTPAGMPVTLIYPSRRNLAPRVRAVIDFIAHEILGRPDPFGADTPDSVGRAGADRALGPVWPSGVPGRGNGAAHP